MTDPIKRALAYLDREYTGEGGVLNYDVTLNFHPDLMSEGRTVIDCIKQSGSYQSQFETGTSSGGLSAFPGGQRWNWESRIFGGSYDNVHPSMRPKYGALNYRRNSVGAAPRFGSCHVRCAPHISSRVSFCYPDSHLQPRDFAVGNVQRLIDLAEKNEGSLDPYLDNYIEAHVHGPLTINEDVDAIVLDPSFKATAIEDAARSLCHIEWHEGFSLGSDDIANCAVFRGPQVATAISQLLEYGPVTPASIWRARNVTLDYQMAKWVWHCLARFGLGATARGDV